MNRRRYVRLLAPVIFAIDLLATTVAPAGATVYNFGPPWTGACTFSADLWNSDGNFKIAPAPGYSYCSNYWQGHYLCGYYGTTASDIWVHGQQINSVSINQLHVYWLNPNQSCADLGGRILKGGSVIVSAGPNAWICANINTPQYYWVWFRTDTYCSFY